MSKKAPDPAMVHLATMLGIIAGDQYNTTPPMPPPEFMGFTADDLKAHQARQGAPGPNGKAVDLGGTGPEAAGRAAYAAGFRGEALVNMIAIAGRESAFDPSSVGDVGLQDSTWGPSVGLFQIRTVKADTGKGGPRDIAYLTGNPMAQAQAAFALSNGGTDFGPWRLHGGGFLDRTDVDQARRIAAEIEGG